MHQQYNDRPVPKARLYDWLEDNGVRVHGIGVTSRRTVIGHLTPAEARAMADRLHELANRSEAKSAATAHLIRQARDKGGSR